MPVVFHAASRNVCDTYCPAAPSNPMLPASITISAGYFSARSCTALGKPRCQLSNMRRFLMLRWSHPRFAPSEGVVQPMMLYIPSKLEDIGAVSTSTFQPSFSLITISKMALVYHAELQGGSRIPIWMFGCNCSRWTKVSWTKVSAKR